MKVNLHTHTSRCLHALGTDEEYVLAALEAGYTTLGFGDHTPFPYANGYENGDKMLVSQLEDYISSVQFLKKKYQGQIEIRMGLECEAVEEFFPFLRQLRDRMDYLILGNHGDRRVESFFGRINTPDGLRHYVETAVKGMETGLFLYLAHPDLMLWRYPAWDAETIRASRDLCREANRLGIPMEYNLRGLSKEPQDCELGYPYPRFWEIAAEENCRAVVGVDAHSPQQLVEADMESAFAFLRSLGLEVLEDPMNA